MQYLPLKIFNQEMNAVAVVSSVSQDCTRKVVLGLHNTHEINRLQQTLESAKSSQNCLDGNFLYIYILGDLAELPRKLLSNNIPITNTTLNPFFIG